MYAGLNCSLNGIAFIQIAPPFLILSEFTLCTNLPQSTICYSYTITTLLRRIAGHVSELNHAVSNDIPILTSQRQGIIVLYLNSHDVKQNDQANPNS